jgi:ribosome biogenesis GTPase A
MEQQTIQWFPGHMARAEREIAKNLKLVDAVVEILDARIPVSSRNPDLGRMIGARPRILLLNRSDLADQKQTACWLAFYHAHGLSAVNADCKTGKGVSAILPEIANLLSAKTASWRSKGMAGRKIRIMAAGIPNVGKSSLINRLAGGSHAAAENRPGITRKSGWYPVGRGFEVLDTPGVLWPKVTDKTMGEHLAFTGAVRDDVLDCEWLACQLLETLRSVAPEALSVRWKLTAEDFTAGDGYELLQRAARHRGMLAGGGAADTERAGHVLLEEFRSGKLGRITLECAKEP